MAMTLCHLTPVVGTLSLPCPVHQLEDAPVSEAGAAIAQLFDVTGCDVIDSVPVTQLEALFTTADMDFNQELAVLEALLDHGMTAPRFAAPGEIVAGRLGNSTFKVGKLSGSCHVLHWRQRRTCKLTATCFPLSVHTNELHVHYF